MLDLWIKLPKILVSGKLLFIIISNLKKMCLALFWKIATSFLPIALFPILGVLNPKQIAESYAHHIVLLILGAFFVAKAIETNNLHRRIALATIKSIGCYK